MDYSLQTINIKLSSIEQATLDKKMQRLQKHLHYPFVIHIVFAHDAHHLKGDVVTCKINVRQGKKVFHAERQGPTIADTLDEVTEALQRELEKDHDRRKDRHASA
ncbi:MAG: HPF/RaiA family ribosome-associated protein [Candidatus Andersenbacteria bacterium]